MNVKFLGAAMSVTGSCYLITTDKHSFLLDCGQFQGSKALEKLNFGDLGFDPAKIDFMILSHAHVDHCGRIPLLTKRGFKGKIFCTDATADLVDIMLKDSGHIHEMEAEWDNKKAERAGRPLVQPLFTVEEAAASIQYLAPVLYEQLIDINPDIRLRLRDAGHILGASIVELWIKEGDSSSKLVFSGDLGLKNKPILRDPETVDEADYLIMEATYGDRQHETLKESLGQFMEIILKTVRRGGTVVVPSFAVGRTQELIFELSRFYEKDEEFRKTMEDVMVYVDSPMATSATEVFRKNVQDFDDETKELILKGESPLDFKNLRFTRSVEESKELNMNREPKIIISASGMCDAGRIKHHLKNNLWNEKSSVIIVGYQAQGTLGRSLVDGAKNVSIFGERIHINAEIYDLEGFSAHADKEGLLEWLSAFKKAPRKIFLVHGEEKAKNAFAETVRQVLGYNCTVVEDVSEYNLALDERTTIQDVRSRIAKGAEIFKVRDKVAQVHDEVEAILANTNIAIEEAIPAEKMDEISNTILELEKATLKLGALVTKAPQ
jgi:metallo-beta-lactamase family protein